MNHRLLAAAAAALALPLLAACAGISRAGAAEDLRGALAELPGVTDVDLRYTEPVVLDSGKLEFRVAMAQDAEADDVVAVVARTYESFAGTHHGEEGDLFVTLGDDTVHVRSFDPDAEVEAVEQAAEDAVTVFPTASVNADINTQDVATSPHVFTRFTVTIGEQDGDSVLRMLARLERRHGDIANAGWDVQTRDDETGWELGSSSGFPSSQQRAFYDRLRTDLPTGATIMLTDDYATAQVPASATPAEVSAMAGRHLEQLGGVKQAFYTLTSGESFYAMISGGDCLFSADETGGRLKQDFGADCTKVSVATEE
ncbi:hypothetical protein AFL01nite_08570 [Aeromicrobium flavum]|uniref:Lipoprotein n=1 Tax=Aeromicrobium flavum TaxID=416568 RepID=A0A512HT19_9ACTN|nr:hypothetical protein [Aeromicrobium flavum]GEO88530.1 hypothetical protein AFL01nite_08570 [Aeromicrobium flavum]